MHTLTKALAAVRLYAVILWAAAWYGAASTPDTSRRSS